MFPLCIFCERQSSLDIEQEKGFISCKTQKLSLMKEEPESRMKGRRKKDISPIKLVFLSQALHWESNLIDQMVLHFLLVQKKPSREVPRTSH